MIIPFYIDLETGESDTLILDFFPTPAFVEDAMADLMKGHEDALAQSIKMQINTTPQARSGAPIKSMVIHHSGTRASGVADAMANVLKARKHFGVDYAIDTEGNVLKFEPKIVDNK